MQACWHSATLQAEYLGSGGEWMRGGGSSWTLSFLQNPDERSPAKTQFRVDETKAGEANDRHADHVASSGSQAPTVGLSSFRLHRPNALALRAEMGGDVADLPKCFKWSKSGSQTSIGQMWLPCLEPSSIAHSRLKTARLLVASEAVPSVTITARSQRGPRPRRRRILHPRTHGCYRRIEPAKVVINAGQAPALGWDHPAIHGSGGY